MITNVAIIRRSISKVTEMLAGMEIKVTQRGDGAYVNYDRRTGKPILVNLPHLPDGASEKLILAVQGFLDHEVAHILFTDPAADKVRDKRAATKSAKYAKQLAATHNMTEDCYIERRMAARFKGAAYNLSNVRKLVFVDRAEGKVEELRSNPLVEEIHWFMTFNLTMFRAWAGHVECREFMDENHIWDELPTIVSALSFFEKDIAACENSFDTLDLAEKVLDAIEHMNEDQEEEGESDSDEGESGEASESEAAGKPSDDGEGEGTETSSSSKKKDEKEKEKSEKDESENAEIGPETELFLDAMAELEDFEESMKGEITAVYRNEVSSGKHGKWLTFSDDHKTPEEYEVVKAEAVRDQNRRDLEAACDSMIGPTAKQLERLLLSRNRQRFEPGRRSGRLHAANLHRLQSGDPRVFRKKFVDKLKNTAVFILTDASGSMTGSKMTVAAQASYALASMLQRVNIANEVMTFTTDTADSAYAAEMHASEKRLKITYSQKDVCHHRILKSFGERMSVKVVDRFADVAKNNCHMWSNCDPESVKTAAELLSVRPEERKVLMVLSDGQPAFNGDMRQGQHELKKVVKEIDSYEGFEVVGVGIQDDSVRHYYPKHVVLNKVEDLPAAVMGEMRRILLG